MGGCTTLASFARATCQISISAGAFLIHSVFFSDRRAPLGLPSLLALSLRARCVLLHPFVVGRNRFLH